MLPTVLSVNVGSSIRRSEESFLSIKRTKYYREWRREKAKDLNFRLRKAEIQRKYYANDLNKNEKAFVYRLKSRYGLTKEQYDELYTRQEGRCSLCNRHQSELKTRLAVDHDHQSSEIRSLLCAYCNLRVIGRLRKDTVERIHEYLNRTYTGWFVPKKKRKKKRCIRRKNSRTAVRSTTGSVQRVVL